MPCFPNVKSWTKILGVGSLELDPETRIWVEVVSLGGDSRKHCRGGGSETGKGRKATKGVLSNCYYHGEVKLNPLGELWGGQHRPHVSEPSHTRMRSWGVHKSTTIRNSLRTTGAFPAAGWWPENLSGEEMQVQGVGRPGGMQSSCKSKWIRVGHP